MWNAKLAEDVHEASEINNRLPKFIRKCTIFEAYVVKLYLMADKKPSIFH